MACASKFGVAFAGLTALAGLAAHQARCPAGAAGRVMPPWRRGGRRARGSRFLREKLATRKAAEAGKHKLKKRLAKGEKRNRKRMAEVATIYTVDPWVRTPDDIVNDLRPVHDVATQRPRPVNKRVWASVEKSSKEVISAAFAEGLRRDPERLRRWVVLVDGNKDQITLAKRAAKEACVKITIVLDIIHVLEYLWKAAHCFFDDGTREAEQWVTCRPQELLESPLPRSRPRLRRVK